MFNQQDLANIQDRVEALRTAAQLNVDISDPVRALEEVIQRLAAQTSSNSTRIPTSDQSLKHFKKPSTDAPKFSGEFPIESSSLKVNEYLLDIEEKARYYDLLLESTFPPRYLNHTYAAQWASMNFTGKARTLWQKIPPDEKPLSWIDFQDWIRSNFVSHLAREQVVKMFLQLIIAPNENINQRNVKEYVKDFRRVQLNLENAGHELSESFLQDCFVTGLPYSFSADSGFYDDGELRPLKELFKNAERIADRRQQRKGKPSDPPRNNNSSSSRNNHHQHQQHSHRHQRNNDSLPSGTPMELDNVQHRPQKQHQSSSNSNGEHQKLTEADKKLLRRLGICTFCKNQGHDVSNCPHPDAKASNLNRDKGQKGSGNFRINNVESKGTQSGTNGQG